MFDRSYWTLRCAVSEIESESWKFFLIERSKKVSLKDTLQLLYFQFGSRKARYYFGHARTYVFNVSAVTAMSFHIIVKHASLRTRLTASRLAGGPARKIYFSLVKSNNPDPIRFPRDDKNRPHREITRMHCRKCPLQTLNRWMTKQRISFRNLLLKWNSVELI